MGIAQDFVRFRTSYNINRVTISSIARRYRRITRQLNWAFWGVDSETAHSLYVGSYGRDTAAHGVSDVDVGFILPWDTYYQYNAYAYNGQSALLQAVRRSILETYPTSYLSGDGQVVVISFTDNITFEILPAFALDGGSWLYPSAKDGGYWRQCNPRAEMAEIQAASDRTNRNLKYLCRMMRIWRDCWGVKLSGILIDTLAYRFILDWPHRRESFYYHDWMVRDFFAYLARQRRDQVLWNAPGSNSHVLRTGPFERLAAHAHILAQDAIAADLADRVWSRRTRWRQIFGPLYPNA